jgi:hypothetical protein
MATFWAFFNQHGDDFANIYVAVCFGAFIVVALLGLLNAKNDASRSIAFNTLRFFLVTATLLTLLLTFSSYSLYFDHWIFNGQFFFVPVAFTSGGPGLIPIPRSSVLFYVLAFIALALYFALPAALVRAINLQFHDSNGAGAKATRWFFNGAAYLFGAGMGVLTFFVGIGDVTLIPFDNLARTSHHASPVYGGAVGILLQSTACFLLFFVAGADMSGMPGFISGLLSFVEAPLHYLGIGLSTICLGIAYLYVASLVVGNYTHSAPFTIVFFYYAIALGIGYVFIFALYKVADVLCGALGVEIPRTPFDKYLLRQPTSESAKAA